MCMGTIQGIGWLIGRMDRCLVEVGSSDDTLSAKTIGLFWDKSADCGGNLPKWK